MNMKKIIPILLAVILLVSCGDIPVRPVQKFINETKAEVCPDRRINIFDVEFEQKGKNVILTGEMNSQEGLDSMVADLEEEGYTVSNKIRMLPDESLQGKTYGIIKRSVANIRVEPSARSEMATQAVLGTPIRVYKKDGKNNFYVQTPDGYLGWIEKSAFLPLTKKEFLHWRKAEKIIYLADAGYVYDKPTRKSAIISDITATSFLLQGRLEGDFYEVMFPDARTGYVHKDECLNYYEWQWKTKATAKSIIGLAHTFMGRPYLWGGTSTKMMDCSGFVRIVFFMHDIYLPRDASQQVMVGKTVAEGKEEIDKLEPGNLVFFGFKNDDGSERITHVGIYIGEGQFIHEAGDVNILSFNPEDDNYSKYRHNMFIRGKDVINHIGKYDVKRLRDIPLYAN